MLGVSTDVVRHNEGRWGLTAARRDLNKRVIRYRQDIAIRALVARGLMPCPAGGVPAPSLVDRIERMERLFGIRPPH